MWDIIDAAEYDAALRREPSSCVAAVFGDRRSGRELLADARSDARQTMASLTASRRGRAVLDVFAATLETWGPNTFGAEQTRCD